MTVESQHCDRELLNRCVDGETSPEENRRVDRHLQGCSDCRLFVRRQAELARRLRREVAAAGRQVDFNRLERQIVDAARRRPAAWRQLPEALFSWKLVLSAAATAMLALFFFTSVFDPPAAPGPSAIINSFTGRVSSVMILETPKSHHTVIWYSEEAATGNGAESKKL